MGKNHYTNWSSGCNNGYNTGSGCANDVCMECGCDACASDCGCTANTTPCNCGASTGNGGCAAAASPCVCQAATVDGTHVYYEAFDGFKEICVTGTCQQEAAPGRVLDVNATLLGVCPGRRSALGFALTEVDENGAEFARGFQAITIPAHNGSCNQDVQCDTVRFILPEDQSLQSRRHFIVRTQHHYLDASSIWNNSWGCGK